MKNRFLLILTFISITIQAQVFGELTGYVKDEMGTPLFGASVYLENTQIGITTNEDGFFILKGIEPDSYNLTASYLGFQPQTKFNIIVKSKGNQQYNFFLTVASEKLQEIVITNRKISRPKETPLSTQTLSANEIATYPGGNNDVVNVAQSLPGVSPSVGGFRNDLIIRGGAPNETVYYLDGMEIPNINHFSTQGSSGGPVGMLNVAFIDDVTLSSSSFGAQYDNPLSGVLQFKQRKGNNRKFNGNFRLGASETALTLEGPLFKNNAKESKTSFIVSARRSYLKFLFELIGLPIRPDYWDYQYKIAHKVDDYNEISVLGIGSVDDFSIEASKEYDEEQQATLEQVPIIEQQTNTMGVSWKRRFKDGSGFFQTTLSTNSLTNQFTRYQDNETKSNVYFSNNSKETETKFRFQYTKFLSNWKFSTGVNTQYSNYSNSTIDVGSNIDYNTKINFYKYGYFANTTTSFFDDKLDFSFGFRLDADTFTKNNSRSANFSPRMSLSYNLNEVWKLNASLGIYYKILPYTSLGFRDASNNLINKDADYTQSIHYVVGIERILGPASSITFEGFYKKYDKYPISVLDGISLANKGAGFEVLGNEEIETIGKGRTFGTELLYQQKLTNNFYGIFSYTFFYSEFTGFQTSKYVPSVWDSRHLISFTGGYKLKKNWELSSRFRFSGKTPYVPINKEETLNSYPNIVLDYSRLGELKLKTFNQLDVRIDKKWNLKKYAIDLYIEFQNLLTHNAPQPPEYGLERNDKGEQVTPKNLVEIKTDNGKLIPSIGFVIDF
ncbi:carboxypeptidase-like regulatory domain-containing protein [Lutibacter aestuarii]|uniref:Carboxypeptidase-like regulatory domain-containing protein n=1 Tax=Lutibacter aestuarii TaxID=861111 RepID=A0ABW2Z6Z0_9FLAO